MYLMTCSFWLTRLRNVREKYLLCFFVVPSSPLPPFPSKSAPTCLLACLVIVYPVCHTDERIISSASFSRLRLRFRLQQPRGATGATRQSVRHVIRTPRSDPIPIGQRFSVLHTRFDSQNGYPILCLPYLRLRATSKLPRRRASRECTSTRTFSQLEPPT